MRIGHLELEGVGFPLVHTKIVTCDLTNDVHVGATDASMKVASFNHDFHSLILRIHEGWAYTWLGQVNSGCDRFGVSRERSQCIPKVRHER